MKKKTDFKLTTLLDKKEIIPGVFEYSFEKRFDFIPGQVVSLRWDLQNPGRLYSILSGNKESEIKVLFDVNPYGWLTPRLEGMKKGDQLYMSDPMGNFLGTEEPAYWIATGTGISPFISMLRSGMNKDKVLIQGARTLKAFYYQEELQESFGSNYIRCCSKETAEKVFNGRLTFYLEMQDSLPKNYKYYLCGNSEMVVEVRDILIRKQIPFENIRSEIYF